MTGLEALKAALTAENEIIERLIALGETKGQAMTKPEEVAVISSEEHDLLLELDSLEKERLMLTDVVSAGRGWDALVAGLDQDDELKSLVEQMGDNLRRLQEINDLNQVLLHESLQFVQFSLNLIAGDTAVTYARSGHAPSGQSIFDRKV